jgi:hypothetical protein
MLSVGNSTFAENSAQYDGRMFGGWGGAILNAGEGVLMVTNSTFIGNEATFGGAAIANFGTAVLRNTIVGASTLGESCEGTITDGGHNLDSGSSCGFATEGGSSSNVDPKLDPEGLSDHGGPTQTIALAPDSPAIDAGDTEACAATPVNGIDQRGYVRPGEGHTTCSIGAYEYDSSGPPSPTATPTVTPSLTATELPTATPSTTPTSNPSPTSTQPQPNTATPTRAATATPPEDTMTPTFTSLPTATQKPGGGGGCGLSARDGEAGSTFALLLAALPVLLRARRRKRI